MKHLIRHIILLCGLPLLLAGCMEWDYGDAVEDFNATGAGLFITNEGNFQYGNATLSYYDPETQQVQNEVFFRANGMKLGDVAQSMCIHDNKGWVVVNNSHVIFAIDLNTFKEVGRITNLTSPRYIHFLSDEKAYVTQLWDNRIFIINPKKYEITGYIQVPDMTMESGSTEQMVQYGKYVYCNCWSYQNRIIKIDTETDQVDAVAGMALVGSAILAAQKVIVDGDLMRAESEIEDFVWDKVVVLVRIPLGPALEHQASPPVCASTHRRNFSLGTTMRLPIRSAGKPVSCMSS